MKKNDISKQKKAGKVIVTHAANFHSDDLCAAATLIYMLELEGYGLTAKDPQKKIRVIRTLSPEEYEGIADFIVDIGGKYAPKKGLFDHHQKIEGGLGQRANGVKYASFGLVWKEFGKKLTGSASAADWVDRHMVQGIDAMDNGMYLYKPVFPDVHPFLFKEYIEAACDIAKGDGATPSPSGKQLSLADRTKGFDKEFMRLIPVAKDALRVFILKSRQSDRIMKAAKKVYDAAADKRAILSDKYIPTRFAEFKAPEHVEPLVFAFPDLRGGWSAKVVPADGQSYDSRIKFPEEWRGKRDGDMAEASGVPDAIFCHLSGFLAVAKSKAGVQELIRKAFQSLGLAAPKF